LDKRAYTVKKPKRYDIVAFKLKDESDSYFNIKRIIGLPGEKIQIKNGRLFVNGDALTDVPFDSLIMTEGLAYSPITLDEGEYFVLGDNRNASLDSRFAEVGNIKRSRITGRAWARIYPFNEMTLLKDYEVK
jgi:signal peptidase I